MEPLPILCFPFAGAGASVFRRCRENPTDLVKLCPVQLPGREERFGELPYLEVAEAVDGLLAQVLDLVGSSRTVALFGHSLGAVLAYEMAHRLGEIGGLTVTQLFVSGSPPPWSPRDRHATGLTDNEFLRQVEEFAGYTHPALAHPELRELLLPTLRADVAMHESYRAPAGRLLDVPITSIRGVDDELVPREQAAEWATATSRDSQQVELPGNHMYLVDRPAELIQLMADVLADDTARARR